MTEFERQDPVRYLPCMHNFHQEQILLNVLPYHIMLLLYTLVVTYKFDWSNLNHKAIYLQMRLWQFHPRANWHRANSVWCLPKMEKLDYWSLVNFLLP